MLVHGWPFLQRDDGFWKGQPIPALWPRFFVGLALNGAWGFGTALLLRLVGAIRT
jgi:hypothetical protein